MAESQKCKYLFDNCKGCNRFFRRDERYIECPDCGATRKCGAFAIKGTDFCVHHGGKENLSAKYVPNGGRPIVTGKHSTSPLTKLASKYVEIQKSGPIQSLRPAIQVIDDRIIALLDRIEKNYSPNQIENILNAWNKLNSSLPGLKGFAEQSQTAKNAYKILEEEAEKAYHDYMAWDQIMDVVDLRRKLSADEIKIIKDMQAMISAEQAYELVAQLLADIIDAVKDEPNGSKIISAIRWKFGRRLGEQNVDWSGRGEPEVIDVDTSGMGGAELLYTRDTSRPEAEGEDSTSPVSEGLSE